MPHLRERWRTSFIEATTYDWAVEHDQVAGVLGRLVWGTDTAAFYRDIARLSELPAGTHVLDLPCGGGVAFRGLRPEQELAYVAADLSPVMLRRARAEAGRRGIHWIEFVEADVEALPFAERSFDVVVTYTGLHCFPDAPRHSDKPNDSALSSEPLHPSGHQLPPRQSLGRGVPACERIRPVAPPMLEEPTSGAARPGSHSE